MNLDKAKKRIAKKAKMGFQGYPVIEIAYLGETKESASEVLVSFLLDETADRMQERFQSETDARENDVIQSAIVKMIERSEAKTVQVAEGIALRS